MSITLPAEEMTEAEYHRHPALSYSTGKHYLRSPAHYRDAVDNRVESRTFDEGHAIHKLVLGKGGDVVEIPADVLAKNGAISTAEAKAFVEAERAAGRIPLKAHEVASAGRVAEAVARNRDASFLLNFAAEVEVNLFATDPETGVEIRGRLDFLPDPVKGRRVFPVDLKSTVDASPEKVRRTLSDLDYDLQAAMYMHLLRLNGRDDVGPFCFVFAEKARPYGVSVVQVAHEDWLAGGEAKLRYILRKHAACLESGDWSEVYAPGIHALEPPPWYLNDLDRLEMSA